MDPLAALDALVALGLDDPDEAGDGLHLLDVIEALGTHFHEHQADILRWPFKLFCAKWRRMVMQVARREAERERDRRIQVQTQAEREAEQEVRQAHQQRWD
jgi:hypothetical protein